MTHDRAFELLPWLVNESLAAEERDLVDQHVRSCLSCHRELKEQQRLRAALRSQPAVHISAHGGFEKLTHDLDGAAARSAPGRKPFAAFARFAVVGAAGVALLGVLLWLVPQRGGDRYAAMFETLANRSPDAAPALDAGAAIDVIFAQTISAADIEQLLVEIDGRIASGPTDLGRYTVRLADAGAGDAELDALLARLRGDPRVRFAGRSLAADYAP
jgi:hypothetical protein